MRKINLLLLFSVLLLFPLISSALPTCNITGNTCTSCDQVFYNFTGSFTEDYFFGNCFMSNEPTCMDTTDYTRTTLVDADCDYFITNPNNADCAAYDTIDYNAVCPSYDRKGSAVNSSDCYTASCGGAIGDITTVFNFSDSYFAGPLAPVETYFTFTIEVNSTSLNFSFYSDNSNMSIDWGDLNIENVTGTRLNNHTYSTAGFYNISLSGYSTRISFYEGTPEKLRDILTPMSDGLTGITSGRNMFNGCTNITTFTEPHFFDDVSSNVTDLYAMFAHSLFNGDISGWNTSQVINFNSMFYQATSFNQPLNTWNTSSATTMTYMFYGASSFNQPLDNWDVSKVTNMQSMFQGATSFNQDLSNWDTHNVNTMREMFRSATSFNQNLSSWDTSKVTTMQNMFYLASNFNGNISNWNVGNVTNMQFMFNAAPKFNQSLNSWDMHNVTTINGMFAYASNFSQDLNNWNTSKVTSMANTFLTALSFNGNISSWDTSKVKDMAYMFQQSPFNQSIENWNTSNVLYMQAMFYLNQKFNQDISNWNTSKVVQMNNMFTQAINFNQPLDNWDTSKVTTMNNMFQGATSFNQPLSNWDVSKVTNMISMFQSATSFNQDLGNWNVSSVTSASNMFASAGLTPFNYDRLLNGWASKGVQVGIAFNAGSSKYSKLGNLSRDYLTTNMSWTIVDGGFLSAFLFTVEVNETSKNFSFQADSANLIVYWDDGTSETFTGNVVMNHTYSNAGFYNIGITGSASRIAFGRFTGATPEKLRDVLTPMSDALTGITSGYQMFTDCSNITNFTAENFFDSVSTNVNSLRTMFAFTGFNGNVSGWNTSNVNDMSYLFDHATNFNQSLSSWDTSNVLYMTSLFNYASSFNKPLNNWNTSKVTRMDSMFQSATNFNQPLNSWDVSKVTSMSSMFRLSNFNQNINFWNTSSVTDISFLFNVNVVFNQPLNNWDTHNVTTIRNAFSGSTAFNQPLNSWNTSKVTDMVGVFSSATNFNQNLSSWNTSKVTNMGAMFNQATNFNGNVSSWDTHNVTSMGTMFLYATNFNQPLNFWNTSKVTNMGAMFWVASSFNQPIGNWDVSKVTNMDNMLRATAFNQDISNWNVSSLTTATNILTGLTLSPQNYDSLLNGWLANGVKNNVVFSGGSSKYTIIGNLSRYTLINTHNWTITDGGLYTDTNAPNMTLHNYTGSFRNKVESQQLAVDDYKIDSWWLNDTSKFQIDQTGLITNKSSFSSPSLYWLTVYVNDSFNNIASGIVYVNITAEPVETIEIISPQNNVTYDVGNVLISISSPDAVNITYNYNGTNVSYTSPTYLTLVDGNYTLHAYAYFSNGNFNQTQVSFEVAIVPVIPSEMVIGLMDCSIPNTNPLCTEPISMPFSSMYFFNTSGRAISLDTNWKKLSNITCGINNKMECNGSSGELIVRETGNYQEVHIANAQIGNDKIVELGIGVNGVISPITYSSIQTSANVRDVIAGQGLIHLNQGDRVTLIAKLDSGSSTGSIYQASVTLNKI